MSMGFHIRKHRPGETFWTLGTSPDKPYWRATSITLCKHGSHYQITARIFGHKLFQFNIGGK